MSDDLIRDIARSKWRYRAIEATRAHQSQLGCILLAVLNKGHGRLPWVDTTAIVTTSGIVVADCRDKDGTFHRGSLICRIDDLVKNFRGLADHLKLGDNEREEMFSELRKWIRHDYRVKPEYDL